MKTYKQNEIHSIKDLTAFKVKCSHLAKLLTFLCLWFYTPTAFGQNFYDINSIQKIEITFTQPNWDYMLDTAKAGSESFIMAKKVVVNGVAFDSVGVKYKGNSTYNPNQKKNPFHIELDTWKNQDYQGFTDIKLSNVAKDPSFLREVLSYSILRQYMHAPQANYANVYVNGSLIGLFSNAESITKKFVKAHFNSSKNPFFKCNPIAGAGPGTTAKPNLVYLGNDSSKYYAAYEMKSEAGWKQLVALTDSLKNNTAAIEKILDVDRALWMLAFDNVFVNLDSYIGGFAQNYYLYMDDAGRFNPIVWDLNESFGTFSQTGTSNLTTTASKQQLSHLLHLNDAAWPLIQKLLSIPRYKRMYVAHMKTMMNENFANGTYLTTGKLMQVVINNAVNADPNKFFSYAQYQSNLTSDIAGGFSSTPGIKNLMDGRTTFLTSQPDFTANAPVISAENLSENPPTLNSTVFFTVKITNATDAYIGYRFDPFKPFIKTRLFDDGLHGDGAAGDLTYGAAVSVNEVFIQYYFYAENNNAGIFLPVRAEHEFFSVYAKLNTVKKGDLVINEFMADNTITSADEAGEYDDWIELYNNTQNPLSLDNLYLSDSYTNKVKWRFPAGTTIASHSYLIIWADDDEEQGTYHSSIKLSATGEQIILSYPDGTVVDSVSFGMQAADISWQRCPNGTGEFKASEPTFGKENCPAPPYLSVSEKTILMEAEKNSSAFFKITSNVSWQIQCNEPWLFVNPVSSQGDTVITLIADENAAFTERTATIFVTGQQVPSQVISVIQQANRPYISVSDTLYTVAGMADSTQMLRINSNTAWNLKSSQPWLGISKSSGTGNDSLHLLISANTTSFPRSGIVTVSASGLPDFPVQVIQEMSSGLIDDRAVGQLGIYPNPATQSIHLFSNAGSLPERVVLFRPDGQIAAEFIKTDGLTEIEVDSLPPGMYFLQAESKKIKSFTKLKFIKL